MDRPKDKTPPGDTPRGALATRGVTAADIVAYLRQNPDFLLTHPELLEVLTPPNVLRQMFAHPLTDKGLAAFLADWAKTGQSILGPSKAAAE